MGSMVVKNAALAALAALVALLGATPARAVTITVGNATGAAGGTVLVDVILSGSAGESVAGTQNDITFNPDLANLAAASACRINPAISDDAPGCEDDPNSGPCKTLNRSLTDVEGGRRFRGLILSLANTTVIAPADSLVTLYTCEFTIAAGAATGTVITLNNSNCGASDPAGAALPTACVGGSINLNGPVPEVTMTPTVTNTRPPSTFTSTIRTNTPTTTPHGDPGDFDDDDDGCQVVASSTSYLSWLLVAPAGLLALRRRRG